MKKRTYPCEGGGRRTSPTGSSAFPEVKCPCCHYWASPVKKYGEYLIRAHRPVKSDPYQEEEPEELEPYMPEEEDDYIGLDRGGYSVSHGGKYLGTYETLSRATAALYLARCQGNYWPNVWYVNDHGNVTLCVFDGHSLTFTDTAYV